MDGIGGQMDFIRGAALSCGGKPILALPSTARKGAMSRVRDKRHICSPMRFDRVTVGASDDDERSGSNAGGSGKHETAVNRSPSARDVVGASDVPL